MEIEKQRIRKDYAALNIAVDNVLLTPNSPLAQVFDATAAEYDPDRELTPTVLLPRVTVMVSDGSWADKTANPLLADMRWYANGADISTLADWNDKYSIEQEGENRGALYIRRNVRPGERVALHFTALLPDERNGVNVRVQSDPVILTTSADAPDMYSVAIGEDTALRYNPFNDRLSLYEYKVAHGLAEASDAERAKAMDAESYIRTLPVEVYRGNERVTEGFTLRLERINPGTPTTFTVMKPGDEELRAMDNGSLTLDLRTVEKADYRLTVVAADEDQASIQFSVNRLYPAFSVRYTNGTDINAGDTVRSDALMVDYDGATVECPGSIIRFVWYTDTKARTKVAHNEGDTTEIALKDTGIGTGHDDSWLDIYVSADIKPAMKCATDAKGRALTDAQGKAYIFN